MSSETPQRHYSRREILVGASGIASAAGLNFATTKKLRTTPETFTVDISLFTAETVTTVATDAHRDPFHAAHVTKTVVNHVLPTLSTEETTISADVTIVETPVPDDIHGEDSESTLFAFREYLSNTAPDEHVATHSNLLLGDLPGAEGHASGTGFVPAWNFPLTKPRAAVVVSSLPLLSIDRDTAALGLYTGGDAVLVPPIHEIGHNLGLDHHDGHATTDDSWATDHIRGPVPEPAEEYLANTRTIYTTIMLDEYPRLGAGGETNNFGARIPTANEDDSIAVLPTFNPKLDLSHLYNTTLDL